MPSPDPTALAAFLAAVEGRRPDAPVTDLAEDAGWDACWDDGATEETVPTAEGGAHPLPARDRERA